MLSKMLIILRIITLSILFVATTNICGAEDTLLIKRVANLEMQILDLNTRVLQLEKQLKDCTTQSIQVIQKVPAGKAAWRKLQKNMNKEQVRNLLGEPDKIDMFGSFEVWKYKGSSGVTFDDDERVSEWHEPY